MSEGTKLGLGILGVAAVLGISGDLLLRATPWGVNVFVFCAAFVSLAVLLAAWRGVRLREEGRWFALALVVFAALFAWRDSDTLAVINGLAATISLSVAALRSRAGRVAAAGIAEYLFWGFQTATYAFAGALPAAFKDVSWRELGGFGYAPVFAVARGLLISVVPVVVFGSLFVAADAVFEEMVSGIFDFDLARVLGHVLLFGVVFWFSAGLLRLGIAGGEVPVPSGERPRFLSLGILELGVVLGLLNVLFLVFVAVQVRYLFGGAERVLAGADLTYAEYARRGFFELVAVAALVLPLLLVAHWLLRGERRSHTRVFGLLSGALVGLLFVIMASALYRMRLYTQEFGLTELRLYVTAFMLWMAVVFVWFLLTVPLGRRERFAFGALVSGLVVVLALNVVNPDARIAHTNLERLEDGKRFDALYLTTLSADAAPVIHAKGDIRVGEKQLGEDGVLREIYLDGFENAESDWRTWNLSRARAQNLAERTS